MKPLTLAALAALLLTGAPAWAVDCQLACREGECRLDPPPAQEQQPQPGKWRRVTQCEALSVRAGVVDMRYLHGGNWLSPTSLGPRAELRLQLARQPADQPCALPSSACLQALMQTRRAGAGGHGIDAREAQPAGQGEPCSLGLPCGQLLPSSERQRVRLAEPQFQGRLLVSLARGQAQPGYAAELSYPVEAGQWTLERGAWQPASVYRYQLLDAQGRLRASGEFSLLAAQLPERLRALAAQRAQQQGLSVDQAWADALVQSKLWWDLLQHEQGDSP